MERLSNYISFVCIHVAVWGSLGCERRDFTDQCPQGWRDVEDECWAPLSYTGPCSVIANMGGFSEPMKKLFETRCAVQWPCEIKCEPDYTVDCPQGWLDMGDGLCEAPMDYSRNCLKRVRMVSESFKREFDNACGATWPCQKQCEEDFGQQCPQAWQLVENGLCVAPHDSYSGACPPFADLSGLTQIDKKQFAVLCDVSFPCMASAVKKTCETDAPCPSGWDLKGSLKKVCSGGGYQGPCRPLVNMDELVNIGKDKFMEACDVQWPCKAAEASSGPVEIQHASTLYSGPVDVDGVLIDATA